MLNGSENGKEMHIGIRAPGKEKLFGFIAGTTIKTVINKETIK